MPAAAAGGQPSTGTGAPTTTPGGASSGRRNAVPIAAFALILVAVGATVYALIALPNHNDRSQAAQHSTGAPVSPAVGTTPASTAPSSSAATVAGLDPGELHWLHDAVPAHATLYAAADVIGPLHDAGFARVAALRGGAGSAAPGDLLLYDSAAATEPAVAADLRTAVPVARFGSGASATSVAVVLGGSPDHRSVALAADRANRLAADTALAANVALHTTPAVRAALRSGGLDARAATLLALLAGSGPVPVAALPIDAAESAAGRPARTVVLALPGGAVRRGLAELPAVYRPAAVTSQAGRTTLTWPIAIDPVRTVS